MHLLCHDTFEAMLASVEICTLVSLDTQQLYICERQSDYMLPPGSQYKYIRTRLDSSNNVEWTCTFLYCLHTVADSKGGWQMSNDMNHLAPKMDLHVTVGPMALDPKHFNVQSPKHIQVRLYVYAPHNIFLSRHNFRHYFASLVIQRSSETLVAQACTAKLMLYAKALCQL